jgi:alkylation response protein AidB-like acyl-CoA dehydrogenase
MTPDLLAALAYGDEVLDRGIRGPKVELDLLREAGLIRDPLPHAYGGQGWGTTVKGALPLFEALMALGEVNLPVARIYEGHVNAVRLVMDHGSAEQCQSFAGQVSGGAIAGVWGADGSRHVTVNDSVLTGVKTFASGMGDVSIAVLTAKTPNGLQMILADVTDPTRFDHGAWDMLAMVGSRSGQFDCAGLSAQRNQQIGVPDALFAEPAFHGGIWRIIACYSGAMTALARELRRQIEHKTSAADALSWHRLGLAAMEAETARTGV